MKKKKKNNAIYLDTIAFYNIEIIWNSTGEHEETKVQ